MTKRTKLELYCTCGAPWTCSTTLDGVAAILATWNDVHAGDGHAPCERDAVRGARAVMPVAPCRELTKALEVLLGGENSWHSKVNSGRVE